MLPISITYGSHVVDFAKAPQASIEALLSRGVAHLLGNEQSAKVSTWKAKEALKALQAIPGNEKAVMPEGKAKADMVATYGPSDEAVADYLARLVSEAIADIYAGEIGSGRGPALDPVEKELRSLIDTHIANTLAGAGIKFAKNRKLPTEDEVVSFANGTTRTLEEMRANTRKAHGDRFEREAQKRIADQAKKAAIAKQQAEALAKAGPADAEALGL